MYKKLISLLKEEKGYNTVEALLWIAAVAVLCVVVTSALKDRLTGKDGAVNTINETITTLLDEAKEKSVEGMSNNTSGS